MPWTAIESLIQRAELCFERGQFNMVASYLEEIDRRDPNGNMPDALIQRYNRLTDCAEWHAEHHAGADDSPAANSQCEKCQGSKIYRYTNGNVGTCYDCLGKGFQTEQDIVRVKNYWAYRRGELAQRKAAAAGPATQTPFPF